MRILFILTLFLCGAANAEHHRGHYLTEVTGYTQRLVSATQAMNRFAAQADYSDLSDEDQEKVKALIKRAQDGLAAMHNDLAEVTDVLNDESLGVEAVNIARGIINSPNNTQASMLRRFQSVTNAIRAIGFEYRVEPFSALSTAQLYLNHAWDEVAWGLWHINDAAREEIYLDLDAQCAGANHHC